MKRTDTKENFDKTKKEMILLLGEISAFVETLEFKEKNPISFRFQRALKWVEHINNNHIQILEKY